MDRVCTVVTTCLCPTRVLYWCPERISRAHKQSATPVHTLFHLFAPLLTSVCHIWRRMRALFPECPCSLHVFHEQHIGIYWFSWDSNKLYLLGKYFPVHEASYWRQIVDNLSLATRQAGVEPIDFSGDTWWPRQYGRLSADDNFKFIFLNEGCIPIEISSILFLTVQLTISQHWFR